MRAAHYANGYATVDNADWYIDDLVQRKKAAGFNLDLEKLRKAYVEILTDSIDFYDRLALETLNRSPKHVLLLHENDLAALFVGALVRELRKKGWKILLLLTKLIKIPLEKVSQTHSSRIKAESPPSLALEDTRDGFHSKWEDEAAVDAYLDQLGVFSR